MFDRPRCPRTLIIATFDDERHRFDHYWTRLRDSDVPTPETLLLDLDGDDSGDTPTWDTDAIVEWMAAHEFDRAFVRSQHKSATKRFREGSFIERRDPEVIDRTIRSLLNQHIQDGWPHGGGLVVREWLDIDFCRFPTHDNCRPEVRFFLDDGEVIGEYPVIEEATFTCPGHYEYLTDVLSAIDPSVPRHYATDLATTFDDLPWAADMVMDTHGEWYCIELNLNAIRWADEIDGWANTCGHGPLEPWGPLETHSAVFWGVEPER